MKFIVIWCDFMNFFTHHCTIWEINFFFWKYLWANKLHHQNWEFSYVRVFTLISFAFELVLLACAATLIFTKRTLIFVLKIFIVFLGKTFCARVFGLWFQFSWYLLQKNVSNLFQVNNEDTGTTLVIFKCL